jgi:hypothetical protein
MLVPARIGGIRWQSADRGNETEYHDNPNGDGRGTRGSRRSRRPQAIPSESENVGAIQDVQGGNISHDIPGTQNKRGGYHA